MNAAEWIALVAAVIATGSMCVALWQAREAREARFAAQAQAGAARESADIAAAGVRQAQRSARAAEAQAVAAAEQVALMRQQAAASEEERHRLNAPLFTISWHPTMGSYGGVDEFILSYAGGPPILESVDVSVVPGSDIGGITLSGDGAPGEQLVNIQSLAEGIAVRFRASIGTGTSIIFYVEGRSDGLVWERRAIPAGALSG